MEEPAPQPHANPNSSEATQNPASARRVMTSPLLEEQCNAPNSAETQVPATMVSETLATAGEFQF